MTEQLTDKAVQYASDKAIATVTTLFPDGSPQSSLVWIDTDGEHLLVNTERDRQKTRNVKRDPRVSVVLPNPENPYEMVEVRGRVAEIAEDDAAAAHIHQLTQKYMGIPEYPFEVGSPRVLLKITPDKQVVYPPS